MEKWIWNEQNNIKYITLPEWKDLGAIAAFSSRWSGVSDLPFQSLNLGLHVGDDYKKVINNRKEFLKIFALQLENTVCCEQVHGTDVKIIDERYKGRGAYNYSDSISDHDALITDKTGICLMTFYADCLPLYFFDPFKKVIALAHSGWKGTMGKIAQQVLFSMQQSFNCAIEDIKVFIGPGIGKCCYSIQPELAEKVEEKFLGYSDIILYENQTIKWDLKNTNRQILLTAGIKSSNLTVCDLCTACNNDDFFSYRAEQGRTGRMAAIIVLN